MGNDRRLRRLVVDDRTTYLWSFRHRHDSATGVGGPDCRHVLSLYREGGRFRTAIVFRAGPGRVISEGSWEYGSLVDMTENDDRKWLNLYEPGSVRLLVDEATARGLLPGEGAGRQEVDGWPLLEGALSRAAAATPAAPPSSLPGP
ncbi:hypothetical protein OG453_11550 [Streptomyces sp. NBC_01381]|uniref:hypothetical protein n=1 Tax=Streptomyces sp. NBC_01381 TaxID=2903845 RepID=UPI00225996E8|nr:hypothetical protein [Streptomyces sp. NBC_01381]MCX4667288.1 hypothetical protein [Streptomyces sp. NBC_01381]